MRNRDPRFDFNEDKNAFGIEGKAVVIVHALELENLDFNEFQAVIDDAAMVVSKHYPALSKFRPAA